jgi:hypothetical protein
MFACMSCVLNACSYVCMRARMYVKPACGCMGVCMLAMWTCMCACMSYVLHACSYVCMHARMYACVLVCMFACVLVCMLSLRVDAWAYVCSPC